MRLLSFTCMLVLLLAGAAAARQNTIGYESVAAALLALKAKPGASVVEQQGWTVIIEEGGLTIWSFSPASSPAYPAVVKRMLVQKEDGVYIQTAALCQAAKADCDKLMEEFKALNSKLGEAVQGGLAAAGKAPGNATKGAVGSNPEIESLTLRYFALKDSGKAGDAFALLSPKLQTQGTKEEWDRMHQDFNAKAGPVLKRSIKRITVYKDPPGADSGQYFAADFESEFASVPVHCGFVMWRSVGPGEYQVVREEQNLLNAETAKQMSAEQVADFRKRWCR